MSIYLWCLAAFFVGMFAMLFLLSLGIAGTRGNEGMLAMRVEYLTRENHDLRERNQALEEELAWCQPQAAS